MARRRKLDELLTSPAGRPGKYKATVGKPTNSGQMPVVGKQVRSDQLPPQGRRRSRQIRRGY